MRERRRERGGSNGRSLLDGSRLAGGGAIYGLTRVGHGPAASGLLDAVKVIAFAGLLVALVLAIWS